MTIGVGFFDGEDVVLGCDMEMTGGGTLKYRGFKDYYAAFNEEDGKVAAVYAGLETEMRAIWERVVEGLEEADKNSSFTTTKTVREIIARALNEVIGKKKSQFELLVGISQKGDLPILLKGFGNTLTMAGRWEVIGYGNCDLAHFLIQMFDSRGPNNLAQAVLWTTYIIATANKFVQYVGQGVRMCALKNGELSSFDGSMFTARLAEIERRIANMWFAACNSELPKEQLEQTLGISGREIGVVASAFPGLVKHALEPVK